MEHKRPRRKDTDSNISEDVVIEIISRLPVKDLMRFTCVSKSWCSLITSDSHFSTLQFQRAASSDRPFVLLEKEERFPGNRSRKHYNYMLDLDSTSEVGEILNPFDRHDDPDNAPRHDAYIVALCDGLVVLQQRDTWAFALLNPSTGKYHIVPPNPAGNENVIFGGFGSERGRGCYKLVTIVEPDEINYHALDLVIYDVNGAWRKIKSRSQYDGIERLFSLDTFDNNSGTYVNGRLYWRDSMQEHSVEIFGFDLEEEEFFETILPDFGEIVYQHFVIVAFQEKLCMVCKTEIEDERADIFVMNETYDEEKKEWLRCWTIIFSIFDPNIKLEMADDFIYLYPQCFSVCRNKVLFNAD